MTAKKCSCKAFLITIAVLVVIIVVLVVTFESFSTLEYHQYGFKRHKTKGSVDRSKVYGAGGWYVLGPENDFLTLPADAQSVKFNRILVFAKDKLEVTVTAYMQYFLRKDQMHLLHRKFDSGFKPIIYSNALSAMKNKAPTFQTREYFRNRSEVEEELFLAIREHISGSCCEINCEEDNGCTPGCKRRTECTDSDYGFFVDVRHFQLDAVDMPSGLKSKFLKTQVLYEEANIESYKQESRVVRKETDADVKKIQNDGKLIKWNANSNSTLIISQANANATSQLEHARATGLNHIYNELGLTDPTHRTSFDYLRTLGRKDKVNLAINFQQLIAGKL